MIDNHPKREKVIVAGVNLHEPNFEYYMTELANLAFANNMEVVGSCQQNLENLYGGTYFGLGKLNEIKNLAHGLHAKTVVLNDELTPMQIRNIERITKLRVVDRTELILEIFASRAKTRQAKLQVELARLQYELPRLHPSENSLDQQRGGGSVNRGAGESKLELNRRTIGDQISFIKKQLREVATQEEIKAKRRNQSKLPQVALVGYTNAGKSTTMNGLLKQFGEDPEKKVFAKNMLFATLDTSVRRINLDGKNDFILSDTVGFISKLPHNLVESFKATLKEARDADLIVNVVDCSDSNMIQMIKTTQQVLKEVGVSDVPMITAYNKADLTDKTYPEIEGNDILFSAQDPTSIKALAKLISKKIFYNYQIINLHLPINAGKELSYLHDNGDVVQEQFKADGIYVTVKLAPNDLARFARYEY
ncbi:GTPase HflX [Lactobacillus psittaci]|uniref:GTPase HflX n=1 Tax=Lactobacillus psittaci DSM 15354 TaxID=1122152 RepID=A0A0R1S2R1_9LACO|nr:GTPase HflX [Lactobacillus psittaci]KRL63367.1 GTP-binding protein HflX [Lactobacillus psittaci DSM 15354]